MAIAAKSSMGRLASLVLAILLSCLIAAPGTAQNPNDSDVLDKLFAALRLAPDAQTARAIDQQIWLHWTRPSDPELAARMGEVIQARSEGDLPRAMRLLDLLVARHPNYAEAWNQRATIAYMQGDYEASLADIEKVLEYEPRHFGALSGRSLIYLAQGKRALAIKAMQQALEYHPYLAERQLFPELRDITRI